MGAPARLAVSRMSTLPRRVGRQRTVARDILSCARDLACSHAKCVLMRGCTRKRGCLSARVHKCSCVTVRQRALSLCARSSSSAGLRLRCCLVGGLCCFPFLVGVGLCRRRRHPLPGEVCHHRTFPSPSLPHDTPAHTQAPPPRLHSSFPLRPPGRCSMRRPVAHTVCVPCTHMHAGARTHART